MELNIGLAVALIIALVEGVKRLELFNNKWLFFVDLILGLGAGYLIAGNNIKQVIVQGLIIGLSASGLFSGVKNLTERGK